MISDELVGNTLEELLKTPDDRLRLDACAIAVKFLADSFDRNTWHRAGSESEALPVAAGNSGYRH